MSKLPLRDMLLNFKDEVIAYARAGAPHVTEDSYKNRLITCKACTHLADARCTMCGCVVAEKAKWATATCPDNKWENEGEDNNSETS